MKDKIFSLNDGLEMQRQHVAEWKSILRPEYHAKLDEGVLRLNDNVRATWRDGFDVPRGCDIDGVVMNLKKS